MFKEYQSRIWYCCDMLIQVKTSLVGPQVNEINFRTAVRLVGCMLQDVGTVLLVFDAASLRNRFRGSLLASSSWIEIATCSGFEYASVKCEIQYLLLEWWNPLSVWTWSAWNKSDSSTHREVQWLSQLILAHEEACVRMQSVKICVKYS